MKTVKILIATAILSTSFYACKKEEMNIKSGEVNIVNEHKSNIGNASEFNVTDGLVKVIFNKMGTMVIEGNPNLEKLISMYNASTTAIASAKEVFEITEKDQLKIIFDANGNTIASDIPKVQIGSSIDAFIFNFCKVKPTKPMELSITKNNLARNYEEFWNALPVEANQKFLSEVKNLQNELPMNYSLQLSFSENQNPSVIYLDENGNPQPIQNPQNLCESTGNGWIISILCSLRSTHYWM